MESHLGWIHGLLMPATYIHLSGVQADDALLKMYGLKPDEQVPTLSYQVLQGVNIRMVLRPTSVLNVVQP